jgi:hypothetical protein
VIQEIIRSILRSGSLNAENGLINKGNLVESVTAFDRSILAFARPLAFYGTGKQEVRATYPGLLLIGQVAIDLPSF